MLTGPLERSTDLEELIRGIARIQKDIAYIIGSNLEHVRAREVRELRERLVRLQNRKSLIEMNKIQRTVEPEPEFEDDSNDIATAVATAVASGLMGDHPLDLQPATQGSDTFADESFDGGGPETTSDDTDSTGE